MKVSRRAEAIGPFLVMEILERAHQLEAQGRDIIHLEVGEPDFPTPEPIQRAAERAVRAGRTKYTHSLGILSLREAIARHVSDRYGRPVPYDRVIVTPGTSPAMWLLFSALLEEGDEVILGTPHYACYPNIIRFVGGKPVLVPLDERVGFQLDPDAVARAITRRTRAILVNSPANPTGSVLEPDRMAALARLGPPLVSDEIYHGLTYEGEERSALEFQEEAFVLNGFSKAYAMTGWRLGYLIVPETYVRPIQKMIQNFFLSANHFVQEAGIAALTEAQADVARMRGIYRERLHYLHDGLQTLGFSVACRPRGAFYILADARKFGADSLELAQWLLDRAGVAVAPGADFGEAAEGYLRFSYANSIENLKLGLERLSDTLVRDRAP